MLPRDLQTELLTAAVQYRVVTIMGPRQSGKTTLTRWSFPNKPYVNNDVGVSHQTINQWLSVLEASYLIVKLQPYYENFGKRLIKSPKLYFTDVGLACYLLGIENEMQLQRDPIRGALVENLVVMELIKYRVNQGLEPRLFYYRDNHQHEVDVIFARGHELIPIEIKSAQTFDKSFLKNLRYFQALSPDRVPTGHVIYAGPISQKIDPFQLKHYQQATDIFKES